MSFTPFNAPLLAPLLGDGELTPYFSVRSDIEAMVRFEAALAKAEAACGVIPEAAGQAICDACGTFQPDLKLLGEGVARDGVAVPQLVKLLRDHVDEPHRRHVHLGATSQDLIDTSLVLRLAQVARILSARLDTLDARLGDLDRRFGSEALMGRTRMQAAIAMRAGDRIRTWRAPLKDHQAKLQALLPTLLRLQFGGAVGTLDKLGSNSASHKGQEVSRLLAQELGLTAPPAPWHTDRSAIIEFTHWLALVTGTLGKIGQDIVLMAQNGIGDIAVAGAGGSSAMPHKQNPVKGEALVTLARFNAVLISGMHQAMVHEQERSGAAWTLEWMLLPQMVIAAGAATRTGAGLLGTISRIGSA